MNHGRYARRVSVMSLARMCILWLAATGWAAVPDEALTISREDAFDMLPGITPEVINTVTLHDRIPEPWKRKDLQKWKAEINSYKGTGDAYAD